MTESVVMYGISNCDTIKKAKNWLDNKDIEYRFHDYRKQGLEVQLLNHWVDILGWEALLNRRGTSWRKLSEQQKQSIDRNSAIEIMFDNPAIIKRPLLAKGGNYYAGFSNSQYQELFS